MESKLEAKIFKKVEDVSISFRSDLEKLKQKVMNGQGDEFNGGCKPVGLQTKACQLAASLRADAADILQTLPETQRLDFDALVNALSYAREKCVKDYSRLQLKSRQQKVSETLQELATDVERLSHLAFSDRPTEVREVLALQHFIDGVRDPEIQKALEWRISRDLKGALVFAMKFEAAPASNTKGQTPHTSRQRIGHVELKKQTGRRPLNCGREGHLQRSCRARQGAETNNSASWKEVSEKLINGHLGAEVARFWKAPTFKCVISTKCTGENGIFIMGHVNELPCNMIIDTGANVSIIRNDLPQKLKEKYLDPAPRGATDRDGEKD
ncbi:gag-Pol polyprotein [Trichonephila clavipes]|uniref:Gag-Pol polyprotein n=1 Tax=Trichonephila clavipes TaxID=2585209 RepID=A0A8X6RUT7_TRICX|nr:gag-Pol polyprotein [Trichonephila clavipes]